MLLVIDVLLLLLLPLLTVVAHGLVVLETQILVVPVLRLSLRVPVRGREQRLLRHHQLGGAPILLLLLLLPPLFIPHTRCSLGAVGLRLLIRRRFLNRRGGGLARPAVAVAITAPAPAPAASPRQ